MDVVVGALRTPTGTEAIVRAIEEVRRTGGTLHLVAHVPVPRDAQGTKEYPSDARRLEAEVTAWVPELVPDDVAWKVHVPVGLSRPSDAVLLVADLVAAGLIVIGLRSRSRVGKALLGSNAQDILLRAPCPVIAIPGPAESNW